ncbi:hypothetical protein [Mycolicibacterium houstonense]|uniref:hypothetical protein n=1 Tax=Mycolicibacterium houstonense TaxID=146021 RepID=UPI000AA1D379|nr:hypothetical protein [Mycolicibacterium houstonense]
MAAICFSRRPGWRRLAQGAALSAALGLGVLGTPAPATAAPDDGSWDIEAYDECMKKTVRNADLCCIESGGTPTSDPNDTQADGSPNCYAPPAEGASAEQGTAPLPPRGIIDAPVIAPSEVAPAPDGQRPMPTLIAPG